MPFTPSPVLLHPDGCEQHVGIDLAAVHHQRPEPVPVDVHTSMIVPAAALPRVERLWSPASPQGLRPRHPHQGTAAGTVPRHWCTAASPDRRTASRLSGRRTVGKGLAGNHLWVPADPSLNPTVPGHEAHGETARPKPARPRPARPEPVEPPPVPPPQPPPVPPPHPIPPPAPPPEPQPEPPAPPPEPRPQPRPLPPPEPELEPEPVPQARAAPEALPEALQGAPASSTRRLLAALHTAPQSPVTTHQALGPAGTAGRPQRRQGIAYRVYLSLVVKRCEALTPVRP